MEGDGCGDGRSKRVMMEWWAVVMEWWAVVMGVEYNAFVPVVLILPWSKWRVYCYFLDI